MGAIAIELPEAASSFIAFVLFVNAEISAPADEMAAGVIAAPAGFVVIL